MSRSYCLYCYTALGPSEGARAVCQDCGAVNLRVDRQLFWTREQRLVRLEYALKLAALLLALALAYPLLIAPSGMHGYGGVGYAIGAPLLVGFLLWDAASLVTARRALLRHDLIWPLLPLALIAGPALLFGSIAGLVERDAGDFLPALGVVLALGLPALALAAGVRRLVRWIAGQRRRYLCNVLAKESHPA